MAMKRRSNGEGSFTRLKSGTWRGMIMDGYTREGKRNMVSFTAPTKGEVQQKIRIYLATREEGVLASSTDNHFDVWADNWYLDHKNLVQESTYANYRYTLNQLKTAFSGKQIDSIRPMDISRYLNGLYENGCSSSAISKCRAMLIQVFDYAESNEAISRNPARLAKVIRNREDNSNSKDAFTEEEFQTLMRELPNNKLGHSIRVLLISGLRVQELLALRAEDIAEDGSMIRVNRAVKTVDGKAELGCTKSKRSVREIPIPKDYQVYVRYLREHSGKAFIWCSGRGNLLYGVGTFRKWYYRALQPIVGVRPLPPHCCRHTYVSRLESRGVPMEQIAQLVGHSNIMTTSGYLHLRTAVLENAVSVLNSLN